MSDEKRVSVWIPVQLRGEAYVLEVSFLENLLTRAAAIVQATGDEECLNCWAKAVEAADVDDEED